jgi:DNA repair and recombination protein RAD54B
VGKAEWPLHEGKTFCVSTKEIELERSLTKGEYLSGQCFGGSNIATGSISAPNNKTRLARQFVPLQINCPLTPNLGVPEGKQSTPILPVAPLSTIQDCSPQSEHPGLENGGSHWTANWYVIMSSVFPALSFNIL